ncbi:MAG: metallophosphoesterase [Planctomycetes bacterium]|nr:metallophosphoesterase [Planctomycetota bacterium]
MSWLNAAIFLVLIAGHTELWVTLINRSHGLRLPARFLRHLRHFHDVWIPVFPFVLVWFVGLSGPALLRGGSWADLPAGWSAYLALCAAGAVGLVIHIARRWYQAVPAVQVSNHATTVDIVDRLGYKPLGPGPFRFLTYVPGNEIFRVEVAEKTYRLPRLPTSWDGLSILHLTDWHFIGTIDRAFFEEVTDLCEELRADLVVLTGDLLDNQRLVEWLPMTLGRLTAPLGCYFVLGNHDWDLNPDETRKWLEELGWRSAAGRCHVVEHEGHCLALAGTERPWMGQHPDFSIAPDDAFRLLLSHTPDNLPWARRQGVDLMLCGHNHGGQVRLPGIGPVYSPSLHGCVYSGGAYWRPPTLLYVSRGLSGRHPLRWGCKPELTKLVLKASQSS